MARRVRYIGFDITLIIFVIGIVTAWRYRSWIIYGLLCLVVVIVVIKLLRMFIWWHSRHQNFRLADVDSMEGLEFERYIAQLLKRHGFHKIKLTERYDMGVDIIAEKNGTRWGIQVKRHSSVVKASAVRQVVTALPFYNCNRSMVITNSTYSKVAIKLAKSNGCVLVNRDSLSELIASPQQ
jgi:restriction system protein